MALYFHYAILALTGFFGSPTLEIMEEQNLVQMDSQGRIVLPRDVRGKGRRYFACQTEQDGTVHIVPVVGVLTAKQAYFWTKKWQRGEREASEALRKRKYRVISPDKLDHYLRSL
jgi:DNA-binding transcriptional regulator/RsmH inhibitor MraZ